jgi:PAS domain-containing protein
MLDNLLDYIPDGVFTVDAEWRVTFFNRAAEQITGIKRAEAVGRRCCDVFRASICEHGCVAPKRRKPSEGGERAGRQPQHAVPEGEGLEEGQRWLRLARFKHYGFAHDREQIAHSLK